MNHNQENKYAELKPWRDFSDLVRLLQNRGMNVPDAARAEKYLSRIGYYRLSGYFHVFRKWDDSQHRLLDDFSEESDFETVLSLYLFDKKLRFSALDALERIETAIKVDIVHLLGERDPMAHTNPDCLHGNFTKRQNKKSGKTGHEEWLERFEKLVRQAEKRNLPLLKHNMEKYGCLPIWAASCLWDFGAMTWLYGGLKHDDKNKIARKYGAVNGDIFTQWLNSLNEIRNIAAHHDRLWNIKISRSSALITQDQYWKQIDSKQPFFYFCIMQKMMKILCPNSNWSERFDDLMREFPERKESSRVSLTKFGLFENYREWDLWRK